MEYNSNGDCSKYEMPDGSGLPADINGNFKHCTLLLDAMTKNLNIAKACENNAFTKGCIPNYKGNDDVKKESDSSMSDIDANKATSGCEGWRGASIKQTRAYVLADGTILVFYGKTSPAIIAIDTNGAKGPNKWGYDLFSIELKGNPGDLPQYYPGGCAFTEKGGKSTISALNNK